MLLEALSNCFQMYQSPNGQQTALSGIQIKFSQQELWPQHHMGQAMPYRSRQHSVAGVTLCFHFATASDVICDA